MRFYASANEIQRLVDASQPTATYARTFNVPEPLLVAGVVVAAAVLVVAVVVVSLDGNNCDINAWIAPPMPPPWW